MYYPKGGVVCSRPTRDVYAKFHYTGPTGPDRTRADPHGLCRRPARTNGVSMRSVSFGSVRVRAGPVGPV